MRPERTWRVKRADQVGPWRDVIETNLPSAIRSHGWSLKKEHREV